MDKKAEEIYDYLLNRKDIAETFQTEYKTTRDFVNTDRLMHLRLHTVTLTTGKTLEFLRSYNQLAAYKDSNDTYHRTDKTTASPRWSLSTARHVNSYLQGREAEVVEQAEIDDTFSQTTHIFKLFGYANLLGIKNPIYLRRGA
tara:strand:+ start:486 stop:914 length:429 start_codon:yes stop_codon:yes gene_type:complete